MDSQLNTFQNRRLAAILLTVVILLSIPLVAMQFTSEVNWSTSDFVIMGILLLGTGLLCELTMRKLKRTSQRILVCGIVLIAFLLIWAELAVGIFGTPFAGS